MTPTKRTVTASHTSKVIWMKSKKAWPKQVTLLYDATKSVYRAVYNGEFGEGKEAGDALKQLGMKLRGEDDPVDLSVYKVNQESLKDHLLRYLRQKTGLEWVAIASYPLQDYILSMDLKAYRWAYKTFWDEELEQYTVEPEKVEVSAKDALQAGHVPGWMGPFFSGGKPLSIHIVAYQLGIEGGVK